MHWASLKYVSYAVLLEIIIYMKRRSFISGAVDTMTDTKLLKWRKDLMFSTYSSPRLWLLQRTTALSISFLIKRYELDSKSDCMSQHIFIFLLSLVMLEGKNPVLTLLGKVPVAPVTRERLHLVADANCNNRTVLWGNDSGLTDLLVGSILRLRWTPFQTRVVSPWNGIEMIAGQKRTTNTRSVQWKACRKCSLIYLYSSK